MSTAKFNADQTRDILSCGSNEQLVAEIRALRVEVAALRTANSAQNLAISQNTKSTAKTVS